jgi:hypothetical protein
VEPGRLQAGQGLARLDLPARQRVVDLGGGEGLDLRVGSGGVDRLDHPLVVLERPVRMVAADDVDLTNVRLDHADDVLDRVLEGARLALLLGEVAERAGEDADVRRVDVPVDDEVDPVAGLLALDVIRHAAEAEEVVGAEARQPIVEIEPLALAHFLPRRGRDGDPRREDLPPRCPCSPPAGSDAPGLRQPTGQSVRL